MKRNSTHDYIHKVDANESERIRRFLHVVAIGTLAFVAIIAIAIATASHWIRFISHESERQFVAPHVQWIEEHLLDDSDPELQAYVERLGADMARQMDVPADLQLRFYVVDGDMENAFTTLGGHIFIIDELLTVVDNENSLAMVLAHEIAHAVNRDPLTGTGRGILFQVLLSTLSGGGMDAPTSANLGIEMTLNAYSRTQEEAADSMAVAALAERYGHVGGVTQFFEKLGETTDDEDVPTIMSSHPHLDDRIEAIRKQVQREGWVSGDVSPYPASIRALVSSEP
jgi:predicted Zn-dependent protease